MMLYIFHINAGKVMDIELKGQGITINTNLRQYMHALYSTGAMQPRVTQSGIPSADQCMVIRERQRSSSRREIGE